VSTTTLTLTPPLTLALTPAIAAGTVRFSGNEEVRLVVSKLGQALHESFRIDDSQRHTLYSVKKIGFGGQMRFQLVPSNETPHKYLPSGRPIGITVQVDALHMSKSVTMSLDSQPLSRFQVSTMGMVRGSLSLSLSLSLLVLADPHFSRVAQAINFGCTMLERKFTVQGSWANNSMIRFDVKEEATLLASFQFIATTGTLTVKPGTPLSLIAALVTATLLGSSFF